MTALGPTGGLGQDEWWNLVCRLLVPRALAEASGRDPVGAREVGEDIAARGRAFAECGFASRDTDRRPTAAREPGPPAGPAATG
ncbi:hypothetical protein I6A84_29110 [Frankia sp. CNm7]|uniref:Uncharacterized protein n=1 Tax=Frankia nepalensis TaxID=1836974 RepID=A0A937RNC1_9ACTN|nr:hypothetical protein [Frankia nepalensis]MBL7499500.1 hypothetical protein [Frankia nepalensis]MBL7514889.1 hypothetical protein [Frankia nepalensis]MBL7522027.1 hypothetical protein [Frankia nepalensis]MBL7633657.1 hypothetical protein [Frankia nepalensis]